MTVTYRATARPPFIGCYPDGAIQVRVWQQSDVKRWNHGEVDYAEPLPIERASHFDLVPVRDGKAGMELWPKIRFEGTDYEWGQLFGRAERDEIMYAYGCGEVDREAVESVVKSWADDYNVEVRVLWPDQVPAA